MRDLAGYGGIRRSKTGHLTVFAKSLLLSLFPLGMLFKRLQNLIVQGPAFARRDAQKTIVEILRDTRIRFYNLFITSGARHARKS
ncbi:MAG: hypothetical protein JWO97_2161 [Acidobacteria bacterium]|nr:hypothetical protein [Acidobacteriota bacterium]